MVDRKGRPKQHGENESMKGCGLKIGGPLRNVCIETEGKFILKALKRRR